MRTHTEIAQLLRNSLEHQQLPQARLRELAGISQRTLTNVLSGREDFKISTLLALTDRLGLELVMVPREAAQAVSAGVVTQPVIKSRVQEALDRVTTAPHEEPKIRRT